MREYPRNYPGRGLAGHVKPPASSKSQSRQMNAYFASWVQGQLYKTCTACRNLQVSCTAHVSATCTKNSGHGLPTCIPVICTHWHVGVSTEISRPAHTHSVAHLAHATFAHSSRTSREAQAMPSPMSDLSTIYHYGCTGCTSCTQLTHKHMQCTKCTGCTNSTNCTQYTHTCSARTAQTAQTAQTA
jgi:hypothetical protein